MSSRIDDLLGDADDESDVDADSHDDLGDRLAATLQRNTEPSVGMFFRPVSLKFLAQLFRMKPETVERRLHRCQPVDYVNHKGRSSPRYDFHEALGWLVKPKIDIGEWIASQRVQDLPKHISDQYWKAMRTKQIHDLEAQELWHTDDVLEVFGELFILIKETAQLWVENLPNRSDLSNEQYEALVGSVTLLQEEIYAKLVELPGQGRTPNSLERLEAETRRQDEEMSDKVAQATKHLTGDTEGDV